MQINREDNKMAKVGIVMGSDSDMPVMAKAADVLKQLGISFEMRIISAHREPDVFFEYAKTAEEKGFSNYCRRRYGRASAGDVRRDLSDAGHRNTDAYDVVRRQRFAVFHRTDAGRDTGSNRSD